MARPTMKQVRDTPWNGLTVASTFAGWGGSSIGYRLAGYRVVYANEIDRRAADAYELNSSVKVDRRDITDVRGDEIAEMAGCEIDVMDGSPPCQGFSSAAGWRRRDDDHAIALRDLYWRFAQRAGELMPRAVVAENVTGILRDPWLREYLVPIKRYLERSGYRVAYGTVAGKYLGVPQKRRRVILVGSREDVGADPAQVFASIAAAASHRPAAVRDAAPTIGAIVLDAKPGDVGSYKFRVSKSFPASRPMPTLMATGLERTPVGWVRVETPTGDLRPFNTDELAAVSGFPRGFKITDEAAADLGVAWRGFGNSVPPPMARAWGEGVADLLVSEPARMAA